MNTTGSWRECHPRHTISLACLLGPDFTFQLCRDASRGGVQQTTLSYISSHVFWVLTSHSNYAGTRPAAACSSPSVEFLLVTVSGSFCRVCSTTLACAVEGKYATGSHSVVASPCHSLRHKVGSGRRRCSTASPLGQLCA